MLAFIALGNAEIMEFDICPKNNPYKFKNGQYCCSEPIQKEFDQCDGVEEKCHYNSGCDNCKFFLLEVQNSYIWYCIQILLFRPQ